MDGGLKLFVRTLKGLNSNDKTIISSLAMMAKEARKDAILSGAIVEAAVRSISEASVNMKLPFFYVVDSIIKNVGSPYKELFQENIVDAFINTFQSNKDSKIRLKLYNLRLTWKNYFPSDLMNDLDERVRKYDPAWPLVTKFDKAKSIESKELKVNLDKSSPDSTTPTPSRDPRINKGTVPEIKEERKRKIIIKEESNELFTIDRRGDDHIKKVVNKKGRFEEIESEKDIPPVELFGSKDVDLRVKDEEIVNEDNWTPGGVFTMLTNKADIVDVHVVDKVKARSPSSKTSYETNNTPVLQPNIFTENMPPFAPGEPTWRVIVEGFPQFPNIGTDPRLLLYCPFQDSSNPITIGGRKFVLLLDRIQPCIFVNNELHAVRFFCSDIVLYVDNIPFVLPANGYAHIKINRRFYIACLGGPGHELIINGWPYKVRIDGNIHQIKVGGCNVNVKFRLNSSINVNIQNAIPPYVCDWAVKYFFGSPQYLNLPPLNPLKNQKLQDSQVNYFREELKTFLRRPFQKSHIRCLPPPVQPSAQQFLMSLPNVQKPALQIQNPVPQLHMLPPQMQNPIPHLHMLPPQMQNPAPHLHMLPPKIQNPVPQIQKPVPQTPVPFVGLDVNDLFQKLLSTGIIKSKKVEDFKLELMKYSWDTFSTRNDKEICDLYTGHQCDLCGTRFKNKDSKEFELHLDYHFYKNTTSLTTTRKSRDYVSGFRQWIVGGSLRINNPNFNFEENECEQTFKCPKFDDDKLNKCAVCMEGFKVEWDDDEDSYMLQDCQLHNGKVYHPICFEDADKQLENSEMQNDDLNTSQIELTDQPLEALEKVLQGKSESVVLPDQSQRFSQEENHSDVKDFQYNSVS